MSWKSGIDYSKWNHFGEDDSCNEEDYVGDDVEEEDFCSQMKDVRPRVTRLDQPSRVTIAADPSKQGSVIKVEPSRSLGSTTTTTKPSGKVNFEGNLSSSSTVSASHVNEENEEHLSRDDSDEWNENGTNHTPETASTSSTRPSQPASWTERGGLLSQQVLVDLAQATSSSSSVSGHDGSPPLGSMPQALYWSQDRHRVTFRWALPPAHDHRNDVPERAHPPADHHPCRRCQWACTVQPIMDYSERYTAVGSATLAPRLIIRRTCHLHGKDDNDHHQPSKNSSLPSAKSSSRSYSTIWFQADLPHAVHLDQDEEDIDWILEETRPGERFIIVTLGKAVPMQGLTLWWKYPFLGLSPDQVDPVDPSSWTHGSGDAQSTAPSPSSGESFQQAWQQAHVFFRQQMQARKDARAKSNDPPSAEKEEDES